MEHSTPAESVTVNGRVYRWPQRPLVVVCLDGSSVDYVRAANGAGVTPYLTSLVSRGNIRMAEAVMPTFTNPNNLSIVTGVAPAIHGISGNFFLDRTTGQAIVMDDPSLVRCETILAAFANAGAKVIVITAKDKLRQMLGVGLNGPCFSAEQQGQPVYSSALSEYVMEKAVELMNSERPDLMYLSTSDYIQHMYSPGSIEANRFYAAIDRALAKLDSYGATIVITADHGMNSKADKHEQPCVIYLQTLLDELFGTGAATVILPITDPYVKHHGSLGSFGAIYVTQNVETSEIITRLSSIAGIQLVVEKNQACQLFELPPGRTGDIVVCADRHTVLGTSPDQHDLSVLARPLRSHGGLAERIVPIIFNQPITRKRGVWKLKNYDAFWLGLNAMQTTKECDCSKTPGRSENEMKDQAILDEQLAYYRARAPEYDEWFNRTGRYDRGPEHRGEWFQEVATIEAALEPVIKNKDVLELACGTGRWTKHLARVSAHTLAVDAAPEAIEVNRNQCGTANVEYCVADLFSWAAPAKFEVVFFSFWLSHIPREHFDAFWRMVRLALKPGGSAFFIDSLFEPTSTAVDHQTPDRSGSAQRRLNDGREFRIVKLFYEPAALEKQLIEKGWQGWVRSSGNFFLYGNMTSSS